MEEVPDEAPTPAVSATAPVPSVEGLDPKAIEAPPINAASLMMANALSQRFERVPEPKLKSFDDLKSVVESLKSFEPPKTVSEQSSQGQDYW
jgi:hypothetical protein